MVLAYGTKKNNFFHPQLLTISQKRVCRGDPRDRPFYSFKYNLDLRAGEHKVRPYQCAFAGEKEKQAVDFGSYEERGRQILYY